MSDTKGLCVRNGTRPFELCHKGSKKDMIEVTKLGGQKILVNPDLLEIVEETPDTVITLTTGKKIIVKESRQEIKNLVKSYRRDIFGDT